MPYREKGCLLQVEEFRLCDCWRMGVPERDATYEVRQHRKSHLG